MNLIHFLRSKKARVEQYLYVYEDIISYYPKMLKIKERHYFLVSSNFHR